MHDLQIGDVVRVAPGEFSEVFMFTHRLSDVVYPFVVLTTIRANISLTSGHFLYVNDDLVTAKTARPGDFLHLQDGSKDVITSVRTELRRGLYNPQTIHGDICVDGVRASTYTEAITPRAAHPLLAPLRLLFRYTGWSSSMFDSGATRLARWIS